jgi:hypothetical protein
MAIEGTRQDTFKVDVWVEDVSNPNRPMMPLGVFDKKTGGEVDSEEYKYNPGGMAEPVSLGGRRNNGNVTVQRLYRLVRDHANLTQKLFNGAGKASMIIAQGVLDTDGNSFGRPITYRGTLKRVLVPEVDSEGSDAALLELEMTVEGTPVVG